MSDAEMVAAIELIIEGNARVLNEQPVLGLRLRPDGTARIQERRRDGRWVRDQYRSYPSLARCYEASLRAARRGELVAELVAGGMPVALAVNEVQYRDVGP